MKAKYLLSLYALTFSGNLIFNLFNNSFENSYNPNLIYKLSSFILISSFYYLLSKIINEALNLNSLSLSISLFLISYFLFDHLMVFTGGYFSFDVTVIVVSMIWVLKVYKNKKINSYIYLFINYVAMRIFNYVFIDEIGNIDGFVELNTDVIVQWMPSVKILYEKGYYFLYSNNVIEGQGLLVTHVQALLLKLNFGTSTYQFIQVNSFLLLFFTVLVFIDLKISKSNKILVCIIFLSLVLNNSWLLYLIGNSLMLEGIVGFLFSSFLININNFLNQKKYSNVFFISFGSLILSKQFISIIVLIIATISLLSLKKKILLSFTPLVLDLLNKYFLKVNSSFITYSDGIDYSQIIKNILFFENIDLKNIEKIISNITIDIPFTLLLIFYLISNLAVILKTKKINFENYIYFYSGILNFVFIVILYISYWQNIEVESSYRYLVNFLSIYCISIVLNVQKLDS